MMELFYSNRILFFGVILRFRVTLIIRLVHKIRSISILQFLSQSADRSYNSACIIALRLSRQWGIG